MFYNANLLGNLHFPSQGQVKKKDINRVSNRLSTYFVHTSDKFLVLRVFLRFESSNQFDPEKNCLELLIRVLLILPSGCYTSCPSEQRDILHHGLNE